MTIGINFAEPWHLYTDAKKEWAKKADIELTREVCKKHVLYNIEHKAVGYRQDCDDVLYELTNNKNLYAVVHLTYTQNAPEKDPRWPETELYETLDDFVQKRLLPDIADWS